MPHQSPRKNDSAGPSNLPIPNKPFCPHTNKPTQRAYSSTVPPTVPLTKLLLWVLGRKGHAGRSLWGSIRQFSVGSATDTQVIYSEGAGARTDSGGVHMLVDISACLPNLSLNTLIMTNSVCNVLEQSGDAPAPCFHSVSRLFPRTEQLKYISVAFGIVLYIYR